MQQNKLRITAVFCGVVIMCFAGCSSTVKNSGRGAANHAGAPESRQDVETAVSAVMGSVSGQDIKSRDLHKLGHRIATDKETQSAVDVLQKSLIGEEVGVKYCPVDGKRYSARLAVCPVHGVPLKSLDEQ